LRGCPSTGQPLPPCALPAAATISIIPTVTLTAPQTMLCTG
jgi:hypothetical protein